MIYTSNVKKAMLLAYEVHHGQVDKGGYPYIFHPLTVAQSMDTEDEIVVALLHDAIEDGWITERYLTAAGFSKISVDAVCAMTKRDGEPYEDYINRVKTNEIARKVKIADLKHNRDTSRLNDVMDQAKNRAEKYKRALEVLEADNTEMPMPTVMEKFLMKSYE